MHGYQPLVSSLPEKLAVKLPRYIPSLDNFTLIYYLFNTFFMFESDGDVSLY